MYLRGFVFTMYVSYYVKIYKIYKREYNKGYESHY